MNNTDKINMHPLSLDEIGVLIAHLSELADREQQIRETLEQRVKECTRELAVERDQLKRYMDNTGAMIVALDVDGLIIMANRKASNVLEWEQDQLTGKNWFDTVIPDAEREVVRGAFGNIMAGHIEMVQYFENNIHTRKGQNRLIAWNNSYLTDPDGNITGCLSSGQDISDERQIANALKKSERNFRLLSEALPAGMTYLSRDLHYRLVNSSYAAWFGKLQEDFIGVHVREIIGETGVDEMKGYFDQVLSGETVHYDRRLPLATGTIDISTVLVPDVKEDGVIDGFFALAIDVTDKNVTEQQLLQSAKMATLGEMATGIAHELNQPLNVMRLAIDNVQRKANNNKLDPEYLSKN